VGRVTKKAKIIVAAVSLIVAVVFFLLLLFLWPLEFDVYFNEILLAVILIVTIPSAIVDTIHARWLNGIEKQMPVLVRGVSEIQETGLTFIKGFERVVEDEMIKSPLAEEVRKLTVNMSWGLSFEEALQRFRDSIGSNVVNRFCALLLEANRSGGEVRKVFTATAGFMEEMRELEENTTTQMRPYIIIIFAAFFVYLFTSIILLQTFFIPMEEYTGALEVEPLLSPEEFTNFFYRTMMVSAILGGLMSGKIGTRRTLAGLKYAIILVVLGYVIFFFTIPPNWSDLDIVFGGLI
jgi:flagellar protein FlaJ